MLTNSSVRLLIPGMSWSSCTSSTFLVPSLNCGLRLSVVRYKHHFTGGEKKSCKCEKKKKNHKINVYASVYMWRNVSRRNLPESIIPDSAQGLAGSSAVFSLWWNLFDCKLSTWCSFVIITRLQIVTMAGFFFLQQWKGKSNSQLLCLLLCSDKKNKQLQTMTSSCTIGGGR